MQVQAQQAGLFSEPGGVKLGEAAALLVDPTQKDRSIGVKFSAAVAAGAGKKIGLQLSIAQYQQ